MYYIMLNFGFFKEKNSLTFIDVFLSLLFSMTVYGTSFTIWCTTTLFSLFYLIFIYRKQTGKKGEMHTSPIPSPKAVHLWFQARSSSNLKGQYCKKFLKETQKIFNCLRNYKHFSIDTAGPLGAKTQFGLNL